MVGQGAPLFSIPAIDGTSRNAEGAQLAQTVLDSTYFDAQAVLPRIDRTSVRNALCNNYANGEPAKALNLLKIYLRTLLGDVVPIRAQGNNYAPLMGTDNFHNVTCYVDSLLIAMFARMDNFEPLLRRSFDSQDRAILSHWLRFLVNMLRLGETVTTDLIGGFLAACFFAGWTSHAPHGLGIYSQHDTAELFVFITEKLCMPLLSLRVDIAHAGRENMEDDHKLMEEQLLYLPIPGAEEDTPVSLEECLELYFANSISVSRHVGDHHAASAPGNIHLHLASNPSPFDIENPRESRRQRSYSIVSSTYGSGTRRRRRSSCTQSTVVNDNDDDSPTQSTPVNRSPRQRHSGLPEPEPIGSPLPPEYNQLVLGDTEAVMDAKKSLWTSKNEVTFPAWMFLQLMPFYAASTSPPEGSPSEGDINSENAVQNLEARQVAELFANTRPVLGLCLKRYYMDRSGVARRNDRKVLVPETIYLPSFVAADIDTEGAFGNFKLVLESAIFHIGNSLHSGHYVSLTSEQVLEGETESTGLTEKATKKLWRMTSSRKTKHSTPVKAPSSERTSTEMAPNSAAGQRKRRWLLVDDMQPAGEKVQEVEFHSVFETHCPYILFYRMVKLEAGGPPSFDELLHPSASKATDTAESGDEKEHKTRTKKSFLRLHKDKEKDRDYASSYREEKCILM